MTRHPETFWVSVWRWRCYVCSALNWFFRHNCKECAKR